MSLLTPLFAHRPDGMECRLTVSDLCGQVSDLKERISAAISTVKPQRLYHQPEWFSFIKYFIRTITSYSRLYRLADVICCRAFGKIATLLEKK